MGDVIQFPLNREKSRVCKETKKNAKLIFKSIQFELCLNTAIELTYQLFDDIQARGIDLNNNKTQLR